MIVFVDTAFLQALYNARDQNHRESLEMSRRVAPHRLLTTEWVLAEFMNSFARNREGRQLAGMVAEEMYDEPSTTVVRASHDQFIDGMRLYRQRSDKEWSVVDCISFQLMEARSITHVLTFDDHFEQAGFKRFA